MFTALTACLALLGIGIVPFGAFSALRNERLEQTMDLITVTSLSARKVIVGKLLAQAVKLATLFAGMAPFVATSFLLGGIDFVSIVVSLAIVFLASLWVCAAALLVSSLAKTRGLSGALLAGGGFVLLLFFGGVGILPRLLFGLTRGSRWRSASCFGAPSGPQGWWALGIVRDARRAEPREPGAARGEPALVAGREQVHGAANRLLRAVPRDHRRVHRDRTFYDAAAARSSRLAVFGLLHLTIVAAFTVTEDFSVSRRVLRRIQTPSRWSPLWTILWPGGGRGAAYVLLQMVLLIVAVRRLSMRDVGWVVAACGYICFFTGAPAVLLRWAAAAHPRVLHPDWRSWCSSRRHWCSRTCSITSSRSRICSASLYPNRHLLNPLRTIANWRLVETSDLYLVPVIVGVMGVLTYATLMVMNRRTSRTAPIS